MKANEDARAKQRKEIARAVNARRSRHNRAGDDFAEAEIERQLQPLLRSLIRDQQSVQAGHSRVRLVRQLQAAGKRVVS